MNNQSNSDSLTQRQLYRELGHNPDNYADGDRPDVDMPVVDNDHNNLEAGKALARKKLDEYLNKVVPSQP